MKRITITTLVSVAAAGLHVVLTFASEPYRNVVFAVGELFPHGSDVADIADVAIAGMVAVGVAVIAVSAGITWLLLRNSAVRPSD